MPAAAIHSKAAVVVFDGNTMTGASGVLTGVSGFSPDFNEHDTTVLGESSESYALGTDKSLEITLTVLDYTAQAQALKAIRGVSGKTMTIAPKGVSPTSNPLYTFDDCTVRGWDSTLGVNNLETCAFKIRVNPGADTVITKSGTVASP